MANDQAIAIVGGGVSGALTAYHLYRQGVKARIIVVEPRPELGLGLAYSTPSRQHLLNVPAGKISALPEEPDHFLRWLRANHDSSADANTYAPRMAFGQYIRSLIRPAVGIEHVRGWVTDCRLNSSGVILQLNNGSNLRAELAVLATGNFSPAALVGIGKYHEAWDPKAYEGLTREAPVTLIGTGLTAIDVLLRLRGLGHRGVVTAISRRGLLPSRHANYTPTPEPAIPAGTPPSCRHYLRALRTAIRNGWEWRAVIDSLRPVTNDLWLALPFEEQRRFARHLRRRWEIVRHRMAPQIAEIIDRELAAGTLVIRMTRQGIPEGRVINCTGPNMNYRRVDSPLLRSLFRQGLVSTGPLGTGFNATRTGALLGADGKASKVLFTLGPGRLGTLIESIAVPEIREQAWELADVLASHLAERRERAAA